MKLSALEIQQLQDKILDWYAQYGRKLPWRLTQDPYLIHISEVMSQQTQVDRVIPYWEKWRKVLPDYQSLAKVNKSDLLTLWSGLGFNSRALRLQSCAQAVVERYWGVLPESREMLLDLPWIGPYTASAICAFAWNQPEPVIDTNIRRVLIFLLGLDEEMSLKELEVLARELIPEWRSRDWHNALMDYGAVHLTARKTKIKSLWKQSKFEWSDREVRWWILKYLTREKKKLTIADVQNEFPTKDIVKILDIMIKDGLVKVQKNQIFIE